MKASVVATLLAEIMDGVTFVPLLGPPTDERPMVCRLSRLWMELIWLESPCC